MICLLKLVFTMATTTLLPLKIQNNSVIFKFIEWFEIANASTNPDTGRKRKGNGKKHLIEELEMLLSSGSPSKTLTNSIEEFKKSSLLSPEIKKAKETLTDIEFNKFVELMEKVKSGAGV